MDGGVSRGTYVSRYTAQQDHGDHDAEENDDDQRIHETEPMYPWVKYMKIIVPASGLGMVRGWCG
jgi:hypothetical protein